MAQLNRRQVILTGAATMAAAALPAAALMTGEIPAIPKAEMFFTVDEPWGAFVRGHVTDGAFKKAVLELIDDDSDMRENAEDWLFTQQWDDDQDEPIRTVHADPVHCYMRMTDADHPELGEAYERCAATEPGAIPITVVMY